MTAGPRVLPLKVGVCHQRLLDEDLVLCDEQGETVHILNRTAAAIWSLCDGERGLGDIGGQVAALFDGSPKAVEEDVAEIIDALASAGLIVFVGERVPPAQTNAASDANEQ